MFFSSLVKRISCSVFSVSRPAVSTVQALPSTSSSASPLISFPSWTTQSACNFGKYKHKTHKGLSKRLVKTAEGEFQYQYCGRRHNLRKMSSVKRLMMHAPVIAGPEFKKHFARLLPHA
eukprot:GILI01005854.1.p1 GENE.GILI01005854.1~~GILI01005854.1.p1  ORF type:complete len:119 (+),score=25.55 GILI01005854.1:64-420(+)